MNNISSQKPPLIQMFPWDFADALREYGFIDSIYITGGADFVFYRDKDGVRHDIGDPSDYPHEKWRGIVP